MTWRIRGSATAPWMPFVAEQYNFYDPPRRYFWMEATRGGLPVEGLHAYGETDASMRIRLLSLLPIVRVEGPQMMHSETVTLLNNACLFAPGSLLDLPIRWREIDARSVEATNFWSDDRPALGEDGKTLLSQRWSTPIRDYRAMEPYRFASRGEGRYAAPEGEYAYIEIEVLEVSTELAPRTDGQR